MQEGVSATLSGSCLHRLSTTCKNPSLVLGAHPTTAVGESNPFIIKGHPIPFNASGPPSGAVTVNTTCDPNPFNTRGKPFTARGPPTGAVTVNTACDSSPFTTKGNPNPLNARGPTNIVGTANAARDSTTAVDNVNPFITKGNPFIIKGPLIPPRVSFIDNAPFIDRVRHVYHFPASAINDPPFTCELNAASAEKNFKLLLRSEMDIGQVIDSAPFSPMTIGSEFKPPEVLQLLLGDLPNWHLIKKSLTTGSECPLQLLDQAIIAEDFKRAIKKGNKIREEHVEWINEKIKEEISRGWAIALPLRSWKYLKSAVFSPINAIEQETLTPSGDLVPKKRLVHNLSKCGAISNESVNSLTRRDELESVIYGQMHRRYIHHIVGCRLRHPSVPILQAKGDWSSAYKRKHAAWDAVRKSITSISLDDIPYLILSLRLTFGGAFCVPEWCQISEAATDTLLNCKDWNQDELKSKWLDLLPPPLRLPSDIPFAQARSLMVNLPIEDRGKIDVFIDDMVGAILDLMGNDDRLMGAILLTIELLSRQYKHSPLPRKDMINLDKLAAEGRLEERKIVLGWMYDTRRLLISLPTNKHVAWSKQVSDLIANPKTTHKKLSSLVGRLDHAVQVIPLARHFMERIRFAKEMTKDTPFRPYTLNATCKADLQLMLEMLNKAHEGLSMNLLTYRKPNSIATVDACPRCLGGYTKRGRAWRIVLPPHLLGRAHINLLEFLAAVVSIWIQILDGSATSEDCLLVMGDSTTAIGWLHKTRVKTKEMDKFDFQARTNVARKLARLMINNDLLLYSQYFPGKFNVVADSLSRDFDVPPQTLASHLCSLFPTQLHPTFQLFPVPDEIISFVHSILLELPKKEQRLEAHRLSEIHPGAIGNNTSFIWGSKTINSLMDLPSTNATPSSHPSQTIDDILDEQTSLCLQRMSEVPSEMYLRRSVKLDA